MPLSEMHRSRLERLPSLAKPLLTLASVPHPAIATLTYVYGVVLRILQLGTEVDAAVERARLAGDAELRTAGLFRVPLAVNVQELQLAAFVGLGRRRYPRALEQLADDARVLDDPRHPDRKGARERLAIARSVIPRVYDHYERTGELRHPDFPLLSSEHLQLLNPGEPMVYRALVANLHLERTTLFDGDLASADLLRDRLPAYVEAQLRVERRQLDVAQQQALDETIDIIRELYGSFVFGAYHAFLAEEIDADTARASIGRALAIEVSDDAIRMVLAQVELQDYLRSGSLAARARLIGQLVAVDASLRSRAEAVGWVEARLFVTLGDLLLIDAQRDRDRSLERTDASVEDLWLALLRFDAAAAAYRFARALGGDDPTQGLRREREHAATAEVSSTLAVVATISQITPSAEGALGRLRTEALAYLDSSLQTDVGAEVATDPPLRAAVGLDGSVHALRAVAFETLALEASRQLDAACGVTDDLDARSAALERFVDRSWWAAHHAVLAVTLGVEVDTGAPLGFVEYAATRDPERPCF